MFKYNLEKQLKDNWFNTNDTFSINTKDRFSINTNDTFSLIEKWVDEKNLINYKNFHKQLQFAGFDKEEVSISYENDYLTVEGNSSMLDNQYCKKYYLPSSYYDINNINVKFEKCILTVECKLKEEKESKVIKIKIK
jgi:HSP20 family molecular chaperone IbpA